MHYQKAISYLYDTLPMYQRQGEKAIKKMNLEKITTLCTKLANPQQTYKSIHIAGTNGKGSTAHTLAAVLQTAGYNTALYTSPHLQDFTERIRVNGTPIQKDYVTQFVKQYRTLFDTLKPSFFEVSVAMAYAYFAYAKVDIAVIETGLGGRLDATNIITPQIAVITSISLDHTNILGNTLEKIAYEKAGIIKHDTPVIIGDDQPVTAAVFNQIAKEKHAPICYANTHYTIQLIDTNPHTLLVDVEKDGTKWIEKLTFDAAGLYQCNNLPTVLSSIDMLTQKGFAITEHQLRQGLRNIRSLTGFAGRWHTLATKPMIICDIAHNYEGIKHVTQQLLANPNYEALHIIFGMVERTKLEALNILSLLPPKAHYYFCRANMPRSMSTKKLTHLAATLGLQGHPTSSVQAALHQSKSKAKQSDMIFITGSTFVVAEALQASSIK